MSFPNIDRTELNSYIPIRRSKRNFVLAVKVICDHVNGKSEGYGFVKFTSESAASKALKEMNGQLLDGRNIRVCYAHRR
ncbi:glycine-rich RNA-binding protein, putative [Ricinus communis]|uniref:Glycine-rich RNA-binding protein, putative n=1 Tax=Ricinus communis TaxID=3988 RepID=B9T4D4_RICCO|nr:glycine-rich RNA-binding protein, putative [Ricinus communis]